MPCWGLFGQALILSPVGQEEKIIWEGLDATHPAWEQRCDSLSLSVTSFQMALQVFYPMPDSCSLQGENKQQAQLSEIFICDKCDF